MRRRARLLMGCKAETEDRTFAAGPLDRPPQLARHKPCVTGALDRRSRLARRGLAADLERDLSQTMMNSAFLLVCSAACRALVSLTALAPQVWPARALRKVSGWTGPRSISPSA